MSDPEQEKIPTYVVGQEVPDFPTSGEPADHDELIYGPRRKPFVVRVGEKKLVAVVGELFMGNATTVEYALMITGPEDVIEVTPDNIFECDFDLAYPEGYGPSKKKGKKRPRSDNPEGDGSSKKKGEERPGSDDPEEDGSSKKKVKKPFTIKATMKHYWDSQ
jgi:hypothetical protein